MLIDTPECPVELHHQAAWLAPLEVAPTKQQRATHSTIEQRCFD